MQTSIRMATLGLVVSAAPLIALSGPMRAREPVEGRLSGTWIALVPGRDGKIVRSNGRLVISDRRIDWVDPDGHVRHGTYVSDVDNRPPAIDMITTLESTLDGKIVQTRQVVVLGIFKVEGDKLTLCVDACDGAKVRPTKFSGSAGFH